MEHPAGRGPQWRPSGFPLDLPLPAMTLRSCALALLVAMTLAAGPAQAEPMAAAEEPLLRIAPLQAVVGAPPAPGSPTDRDDLAVLVWLQRFRTPEMVGNAWLLLERNPMLFSRALGIDMGKSTPAINKGLGPFLAQVDAANAELKAAGKRLRPYLSHPELKPCLPPEAGYSFPSGHATWYAAAAELLADLVPERRERLLDVGSHGGASRTMCGVHYPSDVDAGQRLGRAAAAQILLSPSWQAFRRQPAVQREIERIRTVPATSLPQLVR